MKFDLFFPKVGETPEDQQAETIFNHPTQVAYVEVNPRHSDWVESGDRVIITRESTSAAECCMLIDELIDDLKQLKPKARRKFKH